MVIPALIAIFEDTDDLAFSADHLGGGDLRTTHRGRSLPELTRLKASIHLLSHLPIGHFTHAALQSDVVQGATVLYGRLFEEMIASIGDGLPCSYFWASFLPMLLATLPRRCYN